MVMHLFHDWAPWGEPASTGVSYQFTQARACRVCGLVTTRNIWSFGSAVDLREQALKDAHKSAMESVAEAQSPTRYPS